MESGKYDKETDKILLHFNILPWQNVTQFAQNPVIRRKSQNDVLCGNVNMDVSLMSSNYAISQVSQKVFSHTCKKR